MISPLQELEDSLHFLINFVVIPLFALPMPVSTCRK
jgi:Na+/H+ antiporter NhaA